MERTKPPPAANNGRTCSTCKHMRRIASLEKADNICVRYPPTLMGGIAPNAEGGIQIISTALHNVTIAAPENWWCGEWLSRSSAAREFADSTQPDNTEEQLQ